MNVSLTPELEKFVAKEVDSGLYQTASEVIRAGLRKLQEDKQIGLRRLPQTIEELEEDILRSVRQLDRGQKIEGKEALRRFRAKVAKVRARE